VSWTPSINATGKLVVQAEVDGANVTGASNAAQGALNSLMDFESELSNTLQNLASTEEVRDAAEQLRPEANNASTQAVMAAANQVSSVIGAHQEAVRTASNGNSGVSTGETAQGAGFWMQGFGFKGEQKERGGVDGYTADTGGFVLGGDKTIGNGDVRVGAAFAYASTGINGEGVTTANRTDIDSYQGTVYGSYDAGAWYVDAALGYGQHQYDTKRYVALAGASITGKHDANQYLAKVGVGYPLAFGRATFTPLASLAYVNLDQDGYTETDPTASGAALTVGSTKTDSLRSGLGAKVSVPLSTGKLNTALEARAIWNHEFADTQQDIASSFVGGTSFTTNGVAQARDSANLGLGLSLNSANGQTLSVNYDAEVKSDYVSHTAALKFRYDF
jgi:outer membrane autotransporter protein